MVKLKITGCDDIFSIHKIDCAEIFHDSFQYTIKKAKTCAEAIARGKGLVITLPPDCDHQKLVQSFIRIGVRCSIVPE